ncbi:serine/threonine-protein kinase [Kitasatospora terrestris]|uniref:Protein kinase domain-containing protein n=1 Tax=Kitasatospora terrestris TaxID=258051 RepID=A0ABP9DCC5_9ACTN
MEALGAGDPRQIGEYRLLRRLGAGGMGQVYLGRTAGGRTVAVKTVHAHFAADPEFRVRFRQEVAAARRVGGRWTAPVLDADTESERPWVATGYVAGPSLTSAVRDFGPLPAAAVRSLGAGLAEALAAVHGKGLVHRDVKPSNVLLALDGPRLIDFGIARALDATVLTRTGHVVGSPGFLSPEQAGGLAAGPASDVFSLGAVLAFAATGTAPFGAAQSTPVLLYRVVHEQPDLDALAAVDPQLRDAVAACLAKDPAQRPSPDDLVGLLAADDRGAAGRLDSRDWLPPTVSGALARLAVDLLDLDTEPAGDPALLSPQPQHAPPPTPGTGSAPAPGAVATAGTTTAGSAVPVAGSAPTPTVTSAPTPPAHVPTPTASNVPAQAATGGTAPTASSVPGSASAAAAIPAVAATPVVGAVPAAAGAPTVGGLPTPPPVPAAYPAHVPQPLPGFGPPVAFGPPVEGTTATTALRPARSRTAGLVIAAVVAASVTGGAVYLATRPDGSADNGKPTTPGTAASAPASSPPASESPSPSAAADASTVPAGFLGTWQGRLGSPQLGSGTADFKITITQGRKGEAVAAIRNNTGPGTGYCDATAELVSSAADRVVLKTRPMSILTGCVANPYDQVYTRNGDGSLHLAVDSFSGDLAKVG